MCHICIARNLLPQIPGKTLVASQSDILRATEYLHTIGFSGLKFEDHPKPDWIRFHMTDYNRFILDKTFGPGKGQKNGRIQWILPKVGALYVHERNKRVLIRGIAKLSQRRPPNPLSKEEIPPYNPAVENQEFTSDERIVNEYKRTQARGRSAYLGFMSQIWQYFNLRKFAGKMDPPNFRLFKDTGPRLRKRGHWWARHRELAVAPRLFNASFNVFVEIFLHEMCHQAVSEIDRVVETVNKGHGPYWQAWMRKVGLNPNRYDKNDIAEYLSPEERADRESRSIKIKEAEQGLIPITVPTPRNLDTAGVSWIDGQGVRQDGYIFKDPRKPKLYSCITDEQVSNGIRTGRGQWTYRTPEAKFYHRQSPVVPQHMSYVNQLPDAIIRVLQRNNILRQQRKLQTL